MYGFTILYLIFIVICSFSDHADYTTPTSAKNKSKKYRFTDQDFNSDGSNCDEDSNENGEISTIDVRKPKFSSTVNESNCLEFDDPAAVSPVKRRSQNIQPDSDSDEADDTVIVERIKPGKGKIQVESSEDSDKEAAVSNGSSNKKELSGKSAEIRGKIIKSFDDSDDDADATIKLPLPKSPQKGSKKLAHDSIKESSDFKTSHKNASPDRKSSSKGKIQVASSDDSDSEGPAFKTYLRRESPTKLSQGKNIKNESNNSHNEQPLLKKPSPPQNTQQDTDDSDSDVPVFSQCKNIKKDHINSSKGKIEVDSSDDSDDKFPVFNPFSNKEHKKVSKTTKKSSDSFDNDSPILNKSASSDKSAKKLVKESDGSDDDGAIVNKSKRSQNSKKDSKKNINKLKTATSDDSEDSSHDNIPILKKPIKQESPKKSKRNKSESENSISDTPCKKIKKQSKVREDRIKTKGEADSDEENNDLSEAQSRVIQKHDRKNHKNTKLGNEEKSIDPPKNKEKRKAKSAHGVSSSDDSAIENDRTKSIKVEKTSRILGNSSKHDVNDRDNKNGNNLNDNDDSDDEFASFMLGRKIEQETEIEKSAPSEESQSKLNNAQSDISSSKKKKSKKTLANAENEAEPIQMILHAECIKSGSEKSTTKVETLEDSEFDTKKVMNEKKKSKKSKKFDIPHEEYLDPGTSVKIKKEKDKSGVGSGGDSENEESFSYVKKEKKRKGEKHAKSERREETSSDRTHMSPPPSKPEKVKKRKSLKSTSSYADENGELSDACSTKSRIVVKKEESVFFANIKIKQEPYASDAESVCSRKRKRSESTASSSERNITFDNIRLKRESSVVKSEPIGKTKKIKRDKSLDDCSIKSEANASDLDDAPPRKKSKKKFSE